jgi:hypothetical protein
MKKIKVEKLPKCDLQGVVTCTGGCLEEARYDAPTIIGKGSWANMCENHFKQCASHGAKIIGSEFVQHISAEPIESNIELCAKEPGHKDLEYWESVLWDGARELECPECSDIKRVEPDATYSYHCEGCGIKLHCPDPII